MTLRGTVGLASITGTAAWPGIDLFGCGRHGCANLAGSQLRGAAAPSAVLPVYYHFFMAVRRKRSVSLPPDLDTQIESAAAEAGLTYSGWLATTARKELTIRAGLEAVAEYEADHGPFNAEELADAESWARRAIEGGRDSGRPGRRRSA